MRKTKIRNLAAGIAFLGFMLTLTEYHDGPWAGAFIGAAMMILGALAALNMHKIKHTEGRKSKNEIHLSVCGRTHGRRDAA